MAELRDEIAATEERIRSERRHMRGAMHSTRAVARDTARSRAGMLGAFSLAMVLGILGALRRLRLRR